MSPRKQRAPYSQVGAPRDHRAVTIRFGGALSWQSTGEVHDEPEQNRCTDAAWLLHAKS